ncbi:MAG: glycosyltransferase family 2 protein [Kordiimonadaceae bacterium]|nr:glycosyltransferase family 2 protein [Kordiimonadaceae bacterium]
MPNNFQQPICSIIIPAHNEDLVIGHTLDTVVSGAQNGEFDIIVVCNGCSDKTSQIAETFTPHVRVIETTTASKTNALNLGLKAARVYPVVFLDADISTSAAAIRAMVKQQRKTGANLAYGQAIFETHRCSWLVRAFYKAWQQNPYFDHKKMGGFFSLNHSALKELKTFPDILNDDEFVRRRFQHNSVWVKHAQYTIKAPHTLRSLINVRSRIYRGNQALTKINFGFTAKTLHQNTFTFATRLIKSPSLWLGAVIFVLTAIAAHSKNHLTPSSHQHWDKDTSARINARES